MGIRMRAFPLKGKKHFTFRINLYAVFMYSILRKGGNMQDYLLESLKLQRIDFLSNLLLPVTAVKKRKGYPSNGCQSLLMS